MVTKPTHSNPFASIKINWGTFHLDCTIESPPGILSLIRMFAFWLVVIAAIFAYMNTHLR